MSHHLPNIADRFLTRRELLQRCGMGMGAWRSGSILGSTGIARRRRQGRRGIQSAAAEEAAVRRQGQARHPPVHERRAVARRHVRPQAAARQVRRQAAADGEPARPSARPARRCRRRSSSRSTARAASRSASSFAHDGRAHRRHLRDPLDARRRAEPRAVAAADELRRRPAGPARASARGSPTAWAPRTRTCPASSRCAPAAIRSRSRRTGRPASCPACYQGTYIDTQHTEIDKLIENIQQPRRSARPSSGGSSTCCSSSTSSTSRRARRRRAARGPHPVVRAGLPHADRRRPTPSTSAASRSTSCDMYGPGTQARQILIARRLLERGVRFVQVWHGAGPAVGQPRRHRSRTTAASPGQCDQAIAALLTDLKQRGLLDDTLVIWGGEFGRTPTVELPHAGRERRQDQRPRPQPLRLHHVAGRRRRARAATSTARPTSSASRPSRTRSTSTTCTPRSCTCSASTTRSSPTATPAATSA